MFDIQLHPVEFKVICTPKSEQPPTYEIYAGMCEASNKGDKRITIWVDSELSYSERVGVLAHESVHAAHRWMEMQQIEGEECLAKITETIFMSGLEYISTENAEYVGYVDVVDWGQKVYKCPICNEETISMIEYCTYCGAKLKVNHDVSKTVKYNLGDK